MQFSTIETWHDQASTSEWLAGDFEAAQEIQNALTNNAAAARKCSVELNTIQHFILA